MLSSRTITKAGRLSSNSATSTTAVRSLSVLSQQSSPLVPSLSSSNQHHRLRTPTTQQQRTLLGLVHAIDKRVYRWAKGVLPPISKTENIALGCGTIGTICLFHYRCWIVIVFVLNITLVKKNKSLTTTYSYFSPLLLPIQDLIVTSSADHHPSNI